MQSRLLAAVDDDVITDDFRASVLDMSTLVFLLVSGLIAATIIFEICKDFVLKSASKYTKPTLDAMFSEMTILGFISLIAFVATFGEALEELSIDLFGEGEKYYITDLVDQVQGYVMWVMVMTMVHLLILLYIKQRAESHMFEFNEMAQDEEQVKKQLRAIDDLPSVTVWSWLSDYLCNPMEAYRKHDTAKRTEAFAIFHTLRREHILQRSENENEGFAAQEHEKRLPHDFDYALYLSISMSNFMTQVASLTPLNWFCIWLYLVVIFTVLILSGQDYAILAGVLLVFAYVDVVFVYYMLTHVNETFEHLVNPAHFRVTRRRRAEENKPITGEDILIGEVKNQLHKNDAEEKDGSFDDEEHRKPSEHSLTNKLRTTSGDSTFFMGKRHRNASVDEDEEGEDDDLDVRYPAKVDPNHTSFVYRLRHSGLRLPGLFRMPKQPQSWLSKLVLGDQSVSRHESLLWGDRMSQSLFVFLFRMHILFVDVTFPIVMGLMVPYVFETFGVWPGVVYLLLLSFPYLLLITYLYSNLLNGLSLVLFSGQLRDTLMQNEALRILKMNKVLRLMIALSKISTAEKKCQVGFGDREYDINDPDIQAEIAQIERIFDTYAASVGSAELNREQLQGVCEACGVQLNEQGYQELFIVCDSDGNGAVSREEFVAWMMSHDKEKDEASMVAYGKHIFSMIDGDGSGEITLDEFRVALRKFNESPYNAGFTDSEILSLLRDFDEDGDGNISLEEFLKAIEIGCSLTGRS